jgi:hypothetical protein
MEIRLHDLFSLLSIRLFQPHDLRIMLNKLTPVIFYIFLIDFFFNFIIYFWVGWKLSFLISFDLFSIGISWSHDQVREFWLFNLVKSNCVFFLIFLLRGYLSLMTRVMGLSTYEFFYWVILISWPKSRVNPVKSVFSFFLINFFYFII